MISYIRGKLIQADDQKAVVETGGIGFAVQIPRSVSEQLPQPGEEVVLHTYFQVSEDAMKLYGFLNEEDLEIFRMLLKVNGIGPRVALGVLSEFSSMELKTAVLSGDVRTLSKAPGLGKKTAEKLLLELKDKFSLEELLDEQKPVPAVNRKSLSGAEAEAAEALTALGYSAMEAMKAVKAVEGGGDMDTETLLSAALQKLALF